MSSAAGETKVRELLCKALECSAHPFQMTCGGTRVGLLMSCA